MAVTPLRAPRGPAEEPRQTPRLEIVNDDPQPSPKRPPAVKLVVDEDGLIELRIGGGPQKPPTKKPKTSDFDRNLAEDIDDTALQALAAYLIEGIESDIESRQEWEQTANETANYLGIKLEDPASTIGTDGTICQAVVTTMLEAGLKLWSTAYAEQLPAGGPVKVERKDPVPVNQPAPQSGGIMAPANPGGGAGVPGGMGPGGAGPNGGAGIPGMAEPSEPGQDPVTESDAAGDDLADALERDLNWYLTIGDRGYYPDHSKMLLNRDWIGIAFKEVFKCPIQNKPISRWIRGQDVIVQGDPSCLDEAGRVTVRKKVRQSVMKRMQAKGFYRDVTLVHPTGRTSPTELVIGATQGVMAQPTLPRDFDHEVYECASELGSGTTHALIGDLAMLDEDETGREPGYPLPYRVTMDVDSRTVLAIRRDWKEGDRDHKRRRRLIKYGMIPATGYYDWGLIHLVGNPTQAATMLQRSGVDAALLANFPAWALKQGPTSKLENTVYRPNAGEVVKVAASGNEKLSDVLMPWPYKDPSPQSLALGQKLESQIKSVAGIIEIPVGEGRIGNTPVGTIMSYIESVSMVPGAVHKADHVSQAEEFELLRELLAEDPACLTRGNKNPARQWQVAEELLSPNLSPKSDPNTPSQIHRLLKIQGLIQLGAQPQYVGVANNRAIFRKAIHVLAGEDADEYILPEQAPSPPPPDPKVVAAQIKAQSEKDQGAQKAQEAQLEHQGKMEELRVESQDRAADREAANTREAMKASLAKQKTGADLVKAGAGQAHEAQQNAVARDHEAGLQADQQSHEAEQSLTAPLSAPEGENP
jgi:hypothetical protein